MYSYHMLRKNNEEGILNFRVAKDGLLCGVKHLDVLPRNPDSEQTFVSE
jgi:hypothetical protein